MVEASPPAAKRARFGWLRLALTLVVLAVVGAYLWQSLSEGWDSVKTEAWRLDPIRVLLSLSLLAVYYPLLVWNWCYLMRLLGQPLTWRKALPIWLGSQLGKFLPGKVWTVAGRIYLSERAGLDPMRVSLSMLLEVGLILTTGASLVALMLVVRPDLPIPGREYALPLLVPSLIALHPRVFSTLFNWGLRILRRKEYRIGWTLRAHMPLVLMLLLSWVVYGSAFYLFVSSLSVSGETAALASLSGFLSVLSLHTLSWIAGFLSFLTPSGLGVREASLAFFLGALMPAPAAALVAILARLWITLAELIAVGSGWLLGDRGRR